MIESTEQKMAELLFSQREEGFSRASFDREIAFYESIGTGDMEMMRVFASPLCAEGCGILSKDPLRNLRYHFVVSAALIARFCIRYGMSTEQAYQLSDLYIMQADESASEDELRVLHSRMLEDYTRHMQRIRYSRTYSKQIVKAIEYINEHLHSRILLHDAAAVLGISDAYFSRLFKAETGLSFSEFVTRQKLENAVKLVQYSEYSDAEISNLLAFSSQSYFIKQFRKHTGYTPHRYRQINTMPPLLKKSD